MIRTWKCTLFLSRLIVVCCGHRRGQRCIVGLGLGSMCFVEMYGDLQMRVFNFFREASSPMVAATAMDSTSSK
jgi:hypothetical protein